MYKFTINGFQYSATWNNYQQLVQVQNYGLGIEFTVSQDDNGFTEVTPCFDEIVRRGLAESTSGAFKTGKGAWKDTSDQLKRVANFLEGTNVVEVCKFMYENNPSKRSNREIVRKARRYDEIKQEATV